MKFENFVFHYVARPPSHIDLFLLQTNKGADQIAHVHSLLSGNYSKTRLKLPLKKKTKHWFSLGL